MTISLPPPYNTGCIDYTKLGFQSMTECRHRCLINKSKDAFGKLPFSPIYTLPSDFKHISPTDLQNLTIMTSLIHFKELCILACHEANCKESYTITKTTSKDHWESMVLIINIPREPTMKIEHVPELKLVEFLVYIMSCFGTWFGLSILHLNPVHVFEVVKRRFHRRPKVIDDHRDYLSVERRVRWCESQVEQFTSKQISFVTHNSILSKRVFNLELEAMKNRNMAR